MSNLKTVKTMYGEFKTCDIVKKFENRTKWQKHSEKQILSFIPGTITHIDVKVGDKVNIGDILFGFKAMKMENKVESEIEGTIKQLNYCVGESFPKGVVLLEFE